MSEINATVPKISADGARVAPMADNRGDFCGIDLDDCDRQRFDAACQVLKGFALTTSTL